MPFQKAVKYGAKLRMAIAGPAGAGKTWTALLLAEALADGKGVAVIDTEHRTASKYADVYDFDSMELTNFHPQKYIDAIHEAEEAGYAVLVIDSLSHAWIGSGGVLEEKDRIAKQKYQGNSFSAWNEASQLQNKLVNTILSSKLHIICTIRSKMDYVLEKNEATGKTTPRKVGMAPVQRDDLAYEFDVFATMEIDNTLIVDKSRCPDLSGAIIAKPDASVAHTLKSWLDGAPAPARKIDTERLNVLYVRGKKAGVFASTDEFTEFLGSQLHMEVETPRELTEEQGKDVEAEIEKRERQASNIREVKQQKAS